MDEIAKQRDDEGSTGIVEGAAAVAFRRAADIIEKHRDIQVRGRWNSTSFRYLGAFFLGAFVGGFMQALLHHLGWW